ncbi:uncharacterized protein LOC112692923 [Sipha flava]|jgi:hypothetical protein|uniref:Uncharacterized protein LOC112692923 n=1 Tax=Sipha flava TaxID=143950 RepID=A0A8B8GMA6_9HEMI|nr:uncharacterized protein LOC112692923 [Sipha flava]
MNSIFEQVGQMEADIECNLPSELIEMIICHFDGRTMLQFKLLSKRYYAIANNACHHNRLWKKICNKEIPKQYIFDLFNKQIDKFVSLESISEIEYEGLYKHWLQWQNTVFNKMLISEQHFLGLDNINIIVCHKLEVKVIFKKHMCILSLIEHDKKVCMENYILESYNPNMQQSIMPNSQTIINQYRKDLQKRMTYYRNGLVVYTDQTPGGNPKKYYTVQLTCANTNTFTTQSWYNCYLNLKPKLFKRGLCFKFRSIMCASIEHGLVIGRTPYDDIIIYDISKRYCMILHSWLDGKYSKATAMYIYLNILFIGTENGYLLAYRLKCRDDLLNLKKSNILLEDRLNIGPIIKLDIMDYMNIKAVIVASSSKVLWIKID